jgi:histidine triad (HIT) family protein
MDNCVFCEIVKGNVPCYRVYEDKDFLAFLSIQPLNLGHTLVIPKQHHRWVWDVPSIGEYYSVVQRIAKATMIALNTEFIASAVIGEEVPHAHVWLVPRFENDGHGGAIIFSNVKEYSEEEMKNTAEKISKAIK